MINDLQYEYRSGIGTDIHRFVEDRKLMLGGVEIPFELGLKGHSDADVVLHAVIDAVLGAAGMGDIGEMFSDADPRWRDADSKDLTLLMRDRVEQQRWEVVNVDITITTEQPKLSPYKGQIKRCISSLLGTDFLNVNVKAKTNEGLGDIGEGMAMSCLAIVLLRRRLKRTL